MAGNIKGITIEFRGDTTKLDKALRQVNTETRAIDKELRNVDKALKFNPTSVDLWRQKQTLLTQKISETKEKLSLLKQQQQAMDDKNVDKQSLEYQKLQREIIETESKLKTFNGQLRQVGNANLKATSEQFKQWGGALEEAGQKMKGLSIAAAAVVTSLGAIAVKAGQSADDLNTLSKVYNIGTGDLQKYKAAADLVDVSVETIAKSHTKLEKSMYSAKDGSGKMADAFDTLGVSVTDADGNLRNSDEVWQDTIKALGNVENETERDALAMQLMGKSAAELNPLIEDGGETYENVAKTMKKYGLDFVDQDTLDKANEFNDELDTMKMIGTVAIQSVGSQLAATLAPALEKVVEWVGKLANWLSTLSPEVLTVVGIVATVIAALAPVLIVLGKLATGISAIINLVGIVGPAIGGIVTTLGPVILIIGALIAVGVLLYKNWDTIKEKAKSLYTAIKARFDAIKTKVLSVWNTIKTKTSEAWTAIKNSIINPIKSAWTSLKEKVDAIKTKISDTWTSIKDKTKEKWDEIKDKITGPFKSAKEKIDGYIETIKGWFPIKLGNLFKGIKLPHFDIEWSTVTAFGKSIDFPSGFDISWYKNGGIFNSPSLIGVGEAGSEAVVPLDKFWDKLDNMSMGNVTINVYPSAGMNETELARKVEQALVRAQKQRQKAYGTI